VVGEAAKTATRAVDIEVGDRLAGGDMPTSFGKRQRERNRQEKQREKEQRRDQRKRDKPAKPVTANGEDPDIAGIIPGPQPPAEDT
jgi:hypothetical protein